MPQNRWPLRHRVFVLALCAGSILAVDSVVSQRRGRPATVVVEGREAVEGEVLVGYRAGSSSFERQRAEFDSSADEVEPVGRRGARRMRSRVLGTRAMLQALRANPDVEYAEPNYIIRLDRQPNDPHFNSLWGLLNIGQTVIGAIGVPGADIKADRAWDLTTGSRANVVGVIDTGIDYNHPDLIANMWTAPRAFSVTIGGVVINCAAGTRGFNAITNSCNPMDDHSHGTHVAGTIGAVGNNGVGVAGVSWVASMMGLKFLSASGSGSTSDAIKAIEFAIQAKAVLGADANVRILNNSWGGGGFSTALRNQIVAANSADMLFVAAAGNSNTNNDTSPHYPSNYDVANVISVASTTNQDQRSSFSNYGASTVHLGAPGTSIASTVPGNSYSVFSGTSMAAPHVAGTAALALAYCGMTTAQVKAALLNFVDPIASMSGRTTTGGRLNAYNTVRACNRVTSVTLTPSVASPRTAGTTVMWTATPTDGVAPYAYKWMVYNGVSWTMNSWSASNTFTWTPTATGTYYVGVWVKSAGNPADAAEAPTSMRFDVVTSATVTSVSLSANRVAPQPVGTAITVTAGSTSGGVSPLQYRWSLFDGTSWTFLTSWSTSAVLGWTPTTPNANYVLRVWVRSFGNAVDAPEATATLPFGISASTRVTNVSITSDVASPRPYGSPITFTATATGGIAPLQYKWMVFNGAWSMQAWTASNTFVWTPTAVGTYSIGVWTKSAGNPADAAETPHAIAFTVTTPAPVSSVSLASGVASPQLSGSTINWTATATGGTAPLQYQWQVFNGSSWQSPTAWSSSNLWAWTPTTPHSSYIVRVNVRGSWNTGAAEATATRAYTISPTPISSVALSALGQFYTTTTMTFLATPTGGLAPYQYKWFLFVSGSWQAASGWGSRNYFVSGYPVAGSYQVRVWARSAGSTVDAPESFGTVSFSIAAPPPFTPVTVSTLASSPHPAGVTVRYSANVSGGVAPLRYRWAVSSGGAYSFFTNWSWDPNVNWTPTLAGNYTLRVWVQGADNYSFPDVPDAVGTAAATVSSSTVQSVALTSDRASPQVPGTTVTWTATPTGGIGPHQYKWMVYNGVAWSMMGWSSSSTFAWTPPSAGSYYVGVWVKSANNPNDAAESPRAVPYTIAGASAPVATVSSLSANLASPQLTGTTVTWTATASGGTQPYQFKWVVFNGSSWTPVTGWSASNTFAWTPNVANSSYVMQAWVRSAGNGVDAPESTRQESFSIITSSPTVVAVTLTPNLTSPRPPGTSITWTAVPTGGVGPYLYKWMVYNGVSWTMMHWTNSSTLTWTPPNAGSYYIGVWVKSAGNPNDAAEKPHAVAYVIQ